MLIDISHGFLSVQIKIEMSAYRNRHRLPNATIPIPMQRVAVVDQRKRPTLNLRRRPCEPICEQMDLIAILAVHLQIN